MKYFILFFAALFMCFISEAQIVNLNPDPDGPPWISGGVDSWSAATQAHYDSIPQMSRISFIDPPSAVDN